MYPTSVDTLQNFSGPSVSPNSWTHICWQRTSNVWRAFVNGIASDNTYTLAAFSSPSLCLSIGVDIGWSSSNSFSSRYKFNGSMFQPMITGKAKYPANFVPATDLSIGASANPVLFFVNPGVSGSLQDLVSTNTMVIQGTGVSATGSRYLTY